MSQGRSDFIENGVYHLLDIPLKQMRILTRNMEYQLRFDHDETSNEPRLLLIVEKRHRQEIAETVGAVLEIKASIQLEC